ncbi:MAG: single-stranded DNA-binding protein [Candidatus Cloacimonetes bacterium]|nr:single-stranded DNA-binding protein [Candidatus Cloacimonadota bacterium]
MAKDLRFPNINQVTITGRLTRDPELRYTQNRTALINLPIAFSRRFQSNGEWQEQTSYCDVVVWSKKAEDCANYLKKGSPILVEGYLQVRTYETKDGQNRKAVEIVSNRVHFLEWNEAKGNSEVATGQNYPEPDGVNTTTDDDVPF